MLASEKYARDKSSNQIKLEKKIKDHLTHQNCNDDDNEK